jgi:Zn-dependent peptidase ImmA (M78 family)
MKVVTLIVLWVNMPRSQWMPYNADEQKQIGALIKQHRGDRTQAWLAAEAGTRTSAISNIEKGFRPVPKSKVSVFARALDIDPALLTSTRISTNSVLEALKEIGFGFRELQALPEEAKKELADYYQKIKGKYLKGETGGRPDPAERAEMLLKQVKISSPPVDLNLILKKKGIMIESSNSMIADGMIVYSVAKKIAGIRYRTGMSNGRTRFTIAHELGHFSLDNTEGNETSCSPDGPNRGKDSERDADNFASNLLMPKQWVLSEMGRQIKGIGDVLKIGRTFDTSQTAAARRLVELANQPCAVILSKGGDIQWGSCSRKLFARVERDAKLAKTSQAAKLLAGETDAERPIRTKSTYWFRDRLTGDFREHSIGIYKDTILSLVWTAP